MTEQEIAILDLERSWWQNAGSKENAIRERFGMRPVRYYQLLVGLVTREDALAHDPLLINRLRRIADARRDGRRARAVGGL